jgi:hypothetical protein
MTPLELRDADHRLIRERFSVVLERMVLELRGIACLGLEEVTPDRKRGHLPIWPRPNIRVTRGRFAPLVVSAPFRASPIKGSAE